MKYTIVADLQRQVMQCHVCEVSHEIPRRLLRDQDALLEFADRVQKDHRECVEHHQNPHLARLSREFRKRLERIQQCEQQRQADRSRAA